LAEPARHFLRENLSNMAKRGPGVRAEIAKLAKRVDDAERLAGLLKEIDDPARVGRMLDKVGGDAIELERFFKAGLKDKIEGMSAQEIKETAERLSMQSEELPGRHAGAAQAKPDPDVPGSIPKEAPHEPGGSGSEPKETPKEPDAPHNEPTETPKEPDPNKAAAEQAGKEHVHEGGIETDPQSPYRGKWDGGGIHDWDGLKRVCDRDGYRIKSVAQDPKTSVRRVTVERRGIDPRTKSAVTGDIKKTIYPKDLTPAQIDQAGADAFKAAQDKVPHSKLDPVGTKMKKDGTPADGFFEATVTAGDPPREIKIQGWYKETPTGDKVITSHAPAFDKSWPVVEPKDY
jgi:Bacterial EndoU nuclease